MSINVYIVIVIAGLFALMQVNTHIGRAMKAQLAELEVRVELLEDTLK